MSYSFLISGGEGHEENQTLGSWIMHHLQDQDTVWGIHLPSFPPVTIMGIEFDFSITSNIVMMWLALLVLVVVFKLAYRNKEIVPHGMANALEAMVLFVRDEIAIPNMGKSLGVKMTPLLCSMFFFILTCNLLGLIPGNSTATANITLTAALATITFVLTQFYGIKENGLGGYLKHLAPAGLPPLLYIIIVPIEILGLFTKPFALCMRLFANMIAGHTVIFALLGLIIVLGNIAVATISVPLAVAINMLELFVAFLQAFIFVMLSALFIGMAAHPDH
jgi:F-type H+-transporting ATPase subunit a